MDPELYEALRREVLPRLRTWPSVRVWMPACGRGDDVWQMALLFREAHQWERTWIWATDEEDDVLRPPADDAERMVAPRITFARHSLVEGGSFNEFQLIICRKGMMNGCSDVSAKRAFSVMHASLCRFGILALAQGETLRHHPHALDYGRLAMDAELHRRMR